MSEQVNKIGYDCDVSALKGAFVSSVVTDLGRAELHFSDGRVLHLTLAGDCCSSSSWTYPGQFLELVGSTIQEIHDREGESRDDLETEFRGTEDGKGTDSLEWHFLVFLTDRGHITIDWHNDSNGYYGGSIDARVESPGVGC